MPAPAPTLRLSRDQALALRLRAQLLAPPGADGVVAALEQAGFARTLGGIDVYLALRARRPGLARADLDRAVERGEAQVLPAARGCIYLVARSQAALALRLADLLSRDRNQRDLDKAGVKPGEVEKLASLARAALEKGGPMTTDGLRRALAPGAVRSLGEQGKKVGVSSPLPAALRQLEFAGKIERTLDGGRLDSERYRWRVTAGSPPARTHLPDDLAGLTGRIAPLFFRAAGVATAADFAAWLGVSQRDARAAIASLALVPAEVEGLSGTGYLLEEHRATLALGPPRDAFALLPFEDNLLALGGGPATLLDPAHHGYEVPTWGSRRGTTTLGEARHMVYRTAVAEGRVVGFWEYDPATGEVALGYFDPPGASGRRRLEELAGDTARFLQQELGHGRSFNLDTDADLSRRASEIRRLGAKPARATAPAAKAVRTRPAAARRKTASR